MVFPRAPSPGKAQKDGFFACFRRRIDARNTVVSDASPPWLNHDPCFRPTTGDEEGMKMLTKIKNELLFAGVFRNRNEKVRQGILEDNRKAAIFWAVIQLIFWSFSLVHAP